MDNTSKMAEKLEKDAKVTDQRIDNLETWALGHQASSKWVRKRVDEIHKWCCDMDGPCHE